MLRPSCEPMPTLANSMRLSAASAKILRDRAAGLARSRAGESTGNSMKEPKHKAEAIVDALLESDQMESTTRYLTSGRRFASLETEEIKKRWTQAARTFLIAMAALIHARWMISVRSLVLEMWHCLVKRSATKPRPLRDVIGRDDDPEGHARIRDRISKFLDDLESPRN